MRPCRAAALMVLLLLASTALHAQGEDVFAGEWRNRNDTRGIVGANIYKEGARWMVQLLGRCHPDPCVWQPATLVALEPAGREGGPPRGLTTYQQANVRRVVTFRLGEDVLLVEVYELMGPVPSRGFSGRNFFSVDELTRTKRTAAPLPPMRPRR